MTTDQWFAIYCDDFNACRTLEALQEYRRRWGEELAAHPRVEELRIKYKEREDALDPRRT